MNICPDVLTLSTYIDGGLTRIERVIVEQHLAVCGDCREVVAVVRWSLDVVDLGV